MTLHQVTTPPEGFISDYPSNHAIYLTPSHSNLRDASWTCETPRMSFSPRYIYGKAGLTAPVLVMYDLRTQVLYAYRDTLWRHGTPGPLTINEEIDANAFALSHQ